MVWFTSVFVVKKKMLNGQTSLFVSIKIYQIYSKPFLYPQSMCILIIVAGGCKRCLNSLSSKPEQFAKRAKTVEEMLRPPKIVVAEARYGITPSGNAYHSIVITFCICYQ